MKNTASSITKLLLATLLIAGLLQCQQKPANPNTSPAKSPAPKKEVPQKAPTQPAQWVSLTNDNVVDVLTQYGQQNPETLVKMTTPMGSMVIKLYTNTPLHRANFIRLVKNNFYQGTMFYRVINHFMIQGGDNDDWERQSLKTKMGSYTLPAEFRAENIHQKGALSMARDYDNNPDKRSVSFEWFIVQGTVYTPGELRGAEQQFGLNITEAQKQLYQTVGGTPHLDGQHTVFGQVIEGLEVIDKIAAVKTDEGDWPIDDITIKFEILK